MNYNKKHKLLTIFFNYDFDSISNGLTQDCNRATTADNIIYSSLWSNSDIEELFLLIEQLINLGYIKEFPQKEDVRREYKMYFITSEGKLAYYNKTFLNQLLRKDKRFLIPVIISSLAFLTSLGNVLYTISNNKKIEKLEVQLEKLEKSKSQMGK